MTEIVPPSRETAPMSPLDPRGMDDIILRADDTENIIRPDDNHVLYVEDRSFALFPGVNGVITWLFIAVLAVAIGVCSWLLFVDDSTSTVEESYKSVTGQMYKDVGSNLTKGG